MFGDTSEEAWLNTYQTNVVGPFLMVSSTISTL
jgi:NAD(P)-dependent dehydrogenase (short-subunit alcohol dehydrogenase family)